MNYEEKLDTLEKTLQGYGRMALAFSGGMDSTFLLLFAKKVLGDNVMAITASAPNFAPDEVAYARQLCRREGIKHEIIDLGSEILESFADNPPNRCYICKHAIFGNMKKTLKDKYPGTVLVDGTNADDLNDSRPSRKAVIGLGILSPLKEAGMTKAEIRRGLKSVGGEIWNKPAFACLASRIPYGETITAEKMTAIYQAESALRDMGFEQIRVQHHGTLARIEVNPSDRMRFFDLGLMDRVNHAVKDAGFLYATLDLGGHLIGSLNEESERQR